MSVMVLCITATEFFVQPAVLLLCILYPMYCPLNDCCRSANLSINSWQHIATFLKIHINMTRLALYTERL